MTSNGEGKEEIIHVRCSASTKRALHEFKAHYGFKSLEEALKKLLELAARHPELVEVKWG